MSASNNSQNSTSGKDQGHPHEPFVSSTGGMFLLICIAIVGSALLVVMVEILYDAIKKRRNKSRESVGDCRQLVDRRETVEDPRRSEASIGTRYEFEKPVENNARLEV